MKTFKQFALDEGGNAPIVALDVTRGNLKAPGALLELNRNLIAVLAQEFPNPYAGYVKAAKMLVNYGITLPRQIFMDKMSDEQVLVVNQYGGFIGANFDGSATPPGSHDEESELYFYWTYKISEKGFYKCSAMITDNTALTDKVPERVEDINAKGALDPRQQH